MNFIARLFRQTAPLQVGISQNHQYKCLVYQAQGQVNVLWLEQQEDEIARLHQALNTSARYQLIWAIPHHYIWSKSLYFPAHYTAEQQYRQLIQQVQQSLPIDLNELNLDYYFEPEPEKKRIKATLYALRKNYAQSLLRQPNTRLDSELHCLVRAIQSLAPDLTQACYQWDQRFFGWEQEEWTIATHAPADRVVYAIPDDIAQLPQDLPDPVLYLLALGASLWNGKA